MNNLNITAYKCAIYEVLNYFPFCMNLVISKKSSTFAPAFVIENVKNDANTTSTMGSMSDYLG